MSELLRVVISLSLSGGALTLLTALLNRLLRKRMPVKFLYGLWLLALLRFLCPFGTEVSLAHRAVSQPQVAVLLVAPDSGTQPARPAENPSTPQPGPAPEKTAPSAPPLPVLLTAVWAAGALAAAGRRWGGYARLKRRLNGEALPVERWEQELFQALTGGRRRVPRLKRSAAADTPMLTGLFRPTVWLPAGTWSREDLGYALRHELTHWRRHDLLFRWTAVGTACLHWFNPAAWYLVRAVDRDGELSCDEAVASALSPAERAGYGELLLRCAMGQAGRARLLAASFHTQKQDLKARLMTIMRTQPDIKKARRLLAAAVVLTAAVSASLGAYALNAAPEEVPGAPDGTAALTNPKTTPNAGDAELPLEDWSVRPADLPSRNLEDQPEEFPLAWPFAVDSETTEIPVSALAGKRVHPITGQVNTHSGVDFPLPQDTPILAAAGGTVIESCFDSALGNHVVLDHGNGLTTLYAHMSSNYTMPKVGAQVEAGAQIGAAGATGMATGPHLHLEVREDGELQDPLDYLPWMVVVSSFQPSEA